MIYILNQSDNIQEQRQFESFAFALTLLKIQYVVLTTSEFLKLDSKLSGGHIVIFNQCENQCKVFGTFSMLNDATMTLISTSPEHKFNDQLTEAANSRLLSRLNCKGITMQLVTSATDNLEDYKDEVLKQSFAVKVPISSAKFYTLPSTWQPNFLSGANLTKAAIVTNVNEDINVISAFEQVKESLALKYGINAYQHLDYAKIDVLDPRNIVTGNLQYSQVMPIIADSASELFGIPSQHLTEAIHAGCIPVILTSRTDIETIPTSADTADFTEHLCRLIDQYDEESVRAIYDRCRTKIILDQQIFVGQLHQMFQ